MEQSAPFWIVPLFLIGFSAFWLLVTTMLLALADWPALAERFPDRQEIAVERFRMCSGGMGTTLPESFGVNFGNCLTLDVTHSGLRVSVWKLFRPFSPPILVPWAEIEAAHRKVLFWPQIRLGFGHPEIGRLTIGLRLARKLAEASRGQFRLPPSP